VLNSLRLLLLFLLFFLLRLLLALLATLLWRRTLLFLMLLLQLDFFTDLPRFGDYFLLVLSVLVISLFYFFWFTMEVA